MTGPGSLIERLTARRDGRRIPWECGASRAGCDRGHDPDSPERKTCLAHLETGQALGDPPRGGQRAKVTRVERRVPFGEVDHPHPGIRRQPPHRGEEIRAAIPPGRAPGAAGIASGRSRRYRNRPRAHRNARHGPAPGRSPRFRRARPRRWSRRGARRGSRVHRFAVGKRRQPDLRDIAPGRPSSSSARTGLPLRNTVRRDLACRNAHRA